MAIKKILKCKITILLLLGWFFLSLVGFWGKDTVYARYKINVKTTPYFVSVFEGVHDGVYPWSQNTVSSWEKWDEAAKVSEKELMLERWKERYITVPIQEAQDIQQEAVPENEPLEFVTVDRDYFSDAIFIGDSRTVGLFEYGGLDDTTFYATVGMNVYDLWNEAFCEIDGQKVTLEQALTAREYGKIYFQIGINEMGRGTVDGFMEAYAASVARFRELQPNAVIFVQGIMKVAKEKSDSDAIFNNAGISERNERIAALADGIDIFYIDMNEAVCDEEGNLNAELTFDNIHLFGSKYGAWVDFLLAHGILKNES